jgi:1,4-dihydroxy-2-naphthoate octaprenyltransferase
MISETFSAQGCDAVTTPLKTTGVSHMHAWLYAVSAVAMLISFVCAAAAVYGYVLVARKERRLKASRNAGDSQEQSSREREQLGRKRFIALCSVLIGCGFVVGLMFTILAEVFLVSCSQWH